RFLGSVFRYKRYVGYQMYKKQETGVEKLKFNQEVYSLYHSGANQQSQKVIWKFFAFAGVAFLALVLVIYFVYRKWSPSEPEKNSTLSSAGNSQNNTTLSPASAPMLSPKTYEDIRLLCGSSMCVYRGVTLTNSDIDNLKRKYNFQLLSVTPFSPDFQIYIYRSKIGVSNEILAGTF
ncbi:MAG TPA: hypothetical protein PKW30_04755, partial [Campylobacterales bacterium]|nr:hypothetical protein [Campylobacterales bacterium]